MRFLIPSLLLAFAVGCGGSVVEAPVVDDDAATDTGITTTDDTSVTPVDDAITPGEDAVIPPDEDAPPPPVDGGPGPDAVTPPPTDGGTTTPGSIACGMASCDSKTQECCVSFGMGGSTQKCVTTGMCKGGGSFPLACTDASACAKGEICCARFGGGGSGASCSKTCMGGTRLCAVDSECAMGQKCVLSMMLGVKTCRGTGGGPGGGG